MGLSVRTSVAEQCQPRRDLVGSCRRWLPLAGRERLWPLGARPDVALLRGGMQGPLWVVEVGARERAEVGAPGQQNRVDVVVGRDGADGDHAHSRGSGGLLPDPVGEGGLGGPAEGRDLVLCPRAGGYVDRRSTV